VGQEKDPLVGCINVGRIIVGCIIVGCIIVGRIKVGRINWKDIAQNRDAIAELREQVAQIVGKVMVEQEVQVQAGAIYWATSKSISPRWSS